MTTPRFLIAKYAPDLRRMEPRNIGVIVWANGATSARFLGEERNGAQKVHPPRHLPIQSRNAYRQWVQYWTHQLAQDHLRSNEGAIVERSAPEFVDVLRSKSKDQYMLVDGGFLMNAVAPSEVDEVAAELFAELVAEPKVDDEEPERREAARTLVRSSKRALDSSGISKRKDFHENFPWLCPVGDTKQPFHFDFALHGPKPTMVMQRVPLWRPQAVHSTAFRFQSMREAYGLPRERCAAFVFATASDLNKPDIHEARRLMDGIGTVIDVGNEDRAAAELLKIVA